HLRERLGSDRLVLLSSVLYALVLVALALLRNLYLLVPVMLLSGAAWIAVLSSLQVAAQTSVPAWVRARALAVYILVFFGSMAAGGALWGLVASHLSITFALLCASAALLLGLFASLRCRLPVTEAEDLAPSLHWPAPLVDEEVDQERGPVMVTLEYDIDPQDAAAFQAAMVEVRAMRRRNGAVSWGLVQDSGNRRLWLEFFIDESWLVFASLRCRLPVTEAEDLAPSLHWPAPLVDEEVDQERGPVMVTLEYDIDPQDAAAFQAAMVEVRAMRRRNGAVSWGLVQDSGNRRLWLEFFIDESWLEHLR
ncbi:MFS transporter, partial [Pseudomonas aeruginosa]|uniref:MFS transporter n=1 Tax=Pseudomonas aeruginosa TaxID=287 RepID=UPI00211C0FBC